MTSTRPPTSSAPGSRIGRKYGPVVGAVLAATTLVTGCSSSSTPRAADRASHHGTTSAGTAGADTSAAGSASATGGSTSAGATPAIDLCAVVTAAQASALDGVAYDTTSTVTNGAFHGCDYHNAGKDRADITDLDITLTTSSGCWAASVSADGPGTPVAGLGDAAFGYSLGLHVRRGAACLTVEGQTLAESKKNWGPDEAMARQVLAALG